MKGVEKLKSILKGKLSDHEIDELISEFTSAVGERSVLIEGDVTESIIVTGNNSKVVINNDSSAKEIQENLRFIIKEYLQNEKKFGLSTIINISKKTAIILGISLLSAFAIRQILFPTLSSSQIIEAQSNITAMTFNNDGSKLITASGSTPVKVWDWKKKQLITDFDGQSKNSLSIAASKDGNYVATGHGNFQNNETSKEGTIKLWDAKTGKLLKILKGHTEQIRTVAFSPDSLTLVSSGHDSEMKIWDVRNRKLIKSIPTQKGITSIAFSNYEKVFASASDDKTIKVWDSNNFHLLYTLKGHKGQILSVTFSPDDQFLVSGSGEDAFDQTVQENSVNIWNLKTKKIQRILTGHDGWVWSVSISGDSKYIASASYDGTIRLWDFHSGKLMGVGDEHTKEVYSVKFSVDNKMLVSGGDDGKLRIWEISVK
jgi:WD40 repeat protein